MFASAHRTLLVVTTLAAAVTPTACARRTAATAATPPGSSRVIQREQLVAGGATFVYDALSRLRPECLRVRSTGSIPRAQPPGGDGSSSASGAGVASNSFGGNSAERAIALYIDGGRAGTVEELRSLSVGIVQELECLSASEATQRFGLNHTTGAILVRTARR